VLFHLLKFQLGMYANRMGQNSIKLPSTLEMKSNKILLFDCLLLFGEELGSYYDSKMIEKQGVNWLQILGQYRNKHNLTLKDPDFVIKEPLLSDSPLRAILPKSPTFYRYFGILAKVRNQIAHNIIQGGYEQTREILEILMSVSMDIKLDFCTNEYAEVIKRFEALNRGEIFSEDLPNGYLANEIDSRNVEIEELLRVENEKYQKVAHHLEEVLSVVEIKEMEYEALYESEQAKTAAVEKMEEELNEARKEAEKLKLELGQNTQRIDNLEKSEIDLKNLIATVAEPILSLANLQTKINEGIHQNLGNSNNKSETESLLIDGIGLQWQHTRGNKKIVLSVAARDLIEYKEGNVLAGVDRAESKIYAERWLKIRPQGGRIFIDIDGHASTLIDDVLIYLGNIAALLGSLDPDSVIVPKKPFPRRRASRG
jgi:hypothetical protein